MPGSILQVIGNYMTIRGPGVSLTGNENTGMFGLLEGYNMIKYGEADTVLVIAITNQLTEVNAP